MTIKIDITSNILDAIETMENISENVMVEAARVSINRAMVTGRKEAAKSLRAKLNIKARDVKTKIGIAKARGNNLRSLEGIISFSDIPMPIIDFVRGNTSIIKQKGLKIKKRRKLKVEIVRGKKFVMKGGFIQRVSSKQVFKRGKSGKFYKQSAPSIAEFISRNDLKRPVSKAMIDSFNKNYANQVDFRMKREQSKMRKARLKKI